MADDTVVSCFPTFEEFLATIPEEGVSVCPLCPVEKFHDTRKPQIVQHLKDHWRCGVKCDSKHSKHS